MSELTTEKLIAIRHAVYTDLLWRLPIASLEQTEQFVANLGLVKSFGYTPDMLRPNMEKIVSEVLKHFLNLKVTFDMNRVESGANGPSRGKEAIEAELAEKYGNLLQHAAGFYLEDGTWRLKMPRGCALYGYCGDHGFIAGILCQPLDFENRFFLLSSSAYGQARAVRLTAADQYFFTSYERPAKPMQNVTSPENQASLAGWKWRRYSFAEPKSIG